MDLRGLAMPFLLLLSGLLYGQEVSVEQLRDSLSRSTADTIRVNLKNEIAWELKIEDPETARHYLQDAICEARSLGFKKGEATAFNYFGVLENIHGRTEDAVRYFQYALKLRSELGDQKGVASLYNNLGSLYVRQGDNLRALEQFQQSLQVVELLADTQRIARANYQIAVAHAELGNQPEALNHLFDYLGYAEAQNDSAEMARAFNLIGTVKAEIELTDEALTYFHRARSIFETLEDPSGLAGVLTNIGLSHGNMGQRELKEDRTPEGLHHHDEATRWYDQALGLYRSVGDSAGVAGILLNLAINDKEIGSVYRDLDQPAQATVRWTSALNLLARCRSILDALGEQRLLVEVLNTTGDVYRRQGRLAEALIITREYMTLAEQTGQSKFIRNGWKDLARLYAQLGQWKEAYQARKTYDELRWADFEQRRMQDVERREVAYGDMKKQIRLLKQEQALAVQDAQLETARTRQRALAGGGAALMLLALLLYNRYRIKTRANRDLAEKNTIIEEERRKSDGLLLNILPAATAEELKQTGRATARRYDSVTVLFTDFVGFTEVSATLSAEALVAELDACFRAFDQITTTHGLEKIKTIGDAYLCVGGLPAALPDHAALTVRAALDMQHWMEHRHGERKEQGQPAFRMRVGIHSGPVVAGVVGDRKFAYDIWGDTVNTAARMESSSEPGRINISESTRSLLPPAFPCSPRGKIAAKGKGELDMFWVHEPGTSHPQ